ncbi:MAG: AraC family transcriptional regulator [Planctomycetes bacterium]|nr:AraC family transcriptional regulator [Planctomycetota bacterium]
MNARASTPPAHIERVNLAIDYIISHLGQRLRLEDVAHAAMLSPFHFHRVFQALMGETLADFVKRLRLERALFMMTHRRKPSLTRIALDCGFSSSSDFSRCFKQRYGTPPRDFDVKAWRDAHRLEIEATVPEATRLHLHRLPPASNPDGFKVVIRELPARNVAYIRVSNPYRRFDAVVKAIRRLEAWAESRGFADGQWLGYQWEKPEITALENCAYYTAVEAGRFTPRGEIGQYRFPPMTVAQVEMRGGVDLELRLFQWFYGVWLPRSRYVPDDLPGFEAFMGRPLAHGTEHYELHAQLPVRPA